MDLPNGFCQMTCDSVFGERISREDSKYVLTTDCVRLACRVPTLLDDGEAFFSLYRAIMPDNSVACLARITCFAMGTMYERVIQVYAQMGFLFSMVTITLFTRGS